jgi:hypothetical protein
MTTSQKTLEASSLQYGNRQPQAETLLSLKTFGPYLIAVGQRNVFQDTGTAPIVDTTAAQTNFSPVGLFPQGCVSRFGAESNGQAMFIAAADGLRSFTSTYNNLTSDTLNVSESIKSELAQAIAASSSDEVQLIHYPRRNWLMLKVGDVIYNYNYTPFFANGQIVRSEYGSFSKFTGKFAQQNVYFLKRNGDILCAGSDGYVYEFDKGNYDDDGANILAIMESAFLKLNEAQDIRIQFKSGVYIQPIFETSVPINYTIESTGGYDANNTDTANFTTGGVGQVGFALVGSSPVGGSRVSEKKLPLR